MPTRIFEAMRYANGLYDTERKILAGRGGMARPDSGQVGICGLAKDLSFGAACGSVPTASVANASMCAQAADGDSCVHRSLHSCHYFRPRALIIYVEPTV